MSPPRILGKRFLDANINKESILNTLNDELTSNLYDNKHSTVGITVGAAISAYNNLLACCQAIPEPFRDIVVEYLDVPESIDVPAIFKAVNDVYAELSIQDKTEEAKLLESEIEALESKLEALKYKYSELVES